MLKWIGKHQRLFERRILGEPALHKNKKEREAFPLLLLWATVIARSVEQVLPKLEVRDMNAAII